VIGKRIVVTRAAHLAAQLVELLRGRGAEALVTALQFLPALFC
jgi:uroporphyrinogen-III synthase